MKPRVVRWPKVHHLPMVEWSTTFVSSAQQQSAKTSPSPMTTPPSFAEIDVQGPDAETFLQGQLANDVSGIEQGRWRYGCYCVPDGRVQALLMIARPGVQQWRLLLPADVAAAVTLRLQRYKLRARCTISSHEVVADHGDPAPDNRARYRCAAFELAVIVTQPTPTVITGLTNAIP